MGQTHAYELTVEQFLQDYCKRRSVSDDNRPRLFALCTADNIVAHFSRSKYSAWDVFVDGQNDTGIDGVAIIANDRVVVTPQDIEQIIHADRELKVTFVFIQATMDREFREHKMTSFAHGVWKFFHPDDLGPRNHKIIEATKLKDAIFENSRWMHLGRPALHMYYLSAGQWVGDEVLQGSILGAEALLDGTGLFKSVEFTALDFRGFLDLRRGLQRRNRGEVHSYMLREIHDVPGVRISFLGAMLVSDLIRIIRHPSADRLNRNVFIENVRGFQGADNIVNCGINQTLKREDVTIFPILNNGVTIVCRDCETVGPKLRIFDYQIVNGCQTSSVIFENRMKLKDRDMLVPAKIVVTRDEKIIESIIRATNSQTEVTEEHILSLQPFNRRLSEYYRAIVLGRVSERLYYDLRQGEFEGNKNIERKRIVQIRDQIQAYASMFLGRPHDAIEHLKDLRDEVPELVFNPDHALDPYYTASLAMYRFYDLLEDRLIDAVFENYRFQYLHVLRSKLFPAHFNLFNWRSAPILCNEANERLLDRDQAKQLYAETGEVIRAAARLINEPELKRKTASRKAFTEAINEVMEQRVSDYQT